MKEYKSGLKAGLPIGLGYLSVSFTFGLMAISSGLTIFQAVLMSMTVLTSAGQLASLKIMVAPGAYIDMLVSQLTINVRYSFMSISLSQKTDSKFKGIYKWLLGFFMTDEIFAVCSQKEEVSRIYFLGVSTLPFFGWSIGTLLGGILGNILPSIVLNSLNIAIYAMFIAIIMPVTKKDKKVALISFIAVIFSVLFYYIPILNSVSTGISISICAILSALIGAIFFPVKE